MIQDTNLYEGMRRWFRRLPDHYIITPHEQIELLWCPRGKNQRLHRECFPDLKQASQRAVSLGPAYNVFVQAVVEPGTTPWNTESTHLLASWYSRDRRPDDMLVGYDGKVTLTSLKPLPYAEPSSAMLQHYPDGDYTCDAVRYYYRSRCTERARVEEEKRRRRQDEGGLR
jgi:hypothetical protein